MCIKNDILRIIVVVLTISLFQLFVRPVFAGEAAETVNRNRSLWQKGPNQNWFIDWNDALAEARTKDKAIFILSTGSDWGGWCRRLRENVLDRKAFLDFADKYLVLLYLDDPHKSSLCPEQQRHNDYVRQALGFGSSVPRVMVVSHRGDLLGKINGGGLKLDQYLARLNEIINLNGSAIDSTRGKELFTKGYLKERTVAKKGPEGTKPLQRESGIAKEDAQGQKNASTAAGQPTVTQQQFKATITGIAVADRFDKSKVLAFSPVDTQIKVPRGMMVIFQVQYDFPDGYSAFIWTRPVKLIFGMGSNPSRLYKGKGIAYGFLTHPANKMHMYQVNINTKSPSFGNRSSSWTICTQNVNIDFE